MDQTSAKYYESIDNNSKLNMTVSVKGLTKYYGNFCAVN